MNSINLKSSGVLFLAAGVAFFIATALAKQIAFYGVGIAFVGVAVAFISKARNAAQK